MAPSSEGRSVAGNTCAQECVLRAGRVGRFSDPFSALSVHQFCTFALAGRKRGTWPEDIISRVPRRHDSGLPGGKFRF
jgi:hypothetical protein